MPVCHIHNDLVVSPDLLITHHVHPRAFGGPDVLENTVQLCASCHDLLHKAEQKVSSGKPGVATSLVHDYLPNQPARQQRLLGLVAAAAKARHDYIINHDIPEPGEQIDTITMSLEVPRWLHHRLKTLSQGHGGLYRYCITVLERHCTVAMNRASAAPAELYGAPPAPVTIPRPPDLIKFGK